MNKTMMLSMVGLGLLVVGRDAFAQSSTLFEGQFLFPGQKLVASGCYFETLMQLDGNLVTYTNAGSNGDNQPSSAFAWWASNTNNAGGYATLQLDNNFVIYNWSDQPVWSTGTVGKGTDHLIQQDDGNLVIYNSSNQPLWASGHYGESLGQTPCETSSVVTNVYANMNFPGNDYNHFPIPPRPSWCGYYCAQDSKCQAYTYVPPGIQGASAVCWLKTGVGTQSFYSGMVSGYKSAM